MMSPKSGFLCLLTLGWRRYGLRRGLLRTPLESLLIELRGLLPSLLWLVRGFFYCFMFTSERALDKCKFSLAVPVF